jgi:predicted TIM-barrel enzyme
VTTYAGVTDTVTLRVIVAMGIKVAMDSIGADIVAVSMDITGCASISLKECHSLYACRREIS